MSLTYSLAAAAVRSASAISPRWGSRIALPLFARVAPRRPIDSADLATMWRADRSTVRIPGVDRRGTDIAVYEWGPPGGEVVVLAHGWDGRASQFATLVRELVADGYRVVAFDAPAHGDSPGRATYLLDWVHALQTVQERHGRFAAVVGHSFGGLAALVAVGHGVAALAVVGDQGGRLGRGGRFFPFQLPLDDGGVGTIDRVLQLRRPQCPRRRQRGEDEQASADVGKRRQRGLHHGRSVAPRRKFSLSQA